jgi:hypothetical protein
MNITPVKKTTSTFLVDGITYTVTYRIGARLKVGDKLIWNYHVSVINAIDAKPRPGRKGLARYMTSTFSNGDVQDDWFSPKERYRIEVPSTPTTL